MNYFDYIQSDPKKAYEYAKQSKSMDEAMKGGYEGVKKFFGNMATIWSNSKMAKGLNDLWKGLTGQTSAEAQLLANERNIENQNYWNKIAMEREDTAHQREVADLQAAGLNPWLSSGGGANAAALSTAQAEPEDGSKILQATSALALMAIVKLIAKKI